VLAKESEQLGLKVDAQLERLQEACKLYCLCKQPYNEDRPMVGCDFCQVSVWQQHSRGLRWGQQLCGRSNQQAWAAAGLSLKSRCRLLPWPLF
jgi:hypothetical protein